MTNRPKADQDKADEQPVKAPRPNDPTFRETRAVVPAKADRITGASQRGGIWYAADGSLLEPIEIQRAHKAMDAAAAEARRKALLGGAE